MRDTAKIITVLPAIAGNGAKFIATNVAHTIKQDFPSKKVALVDFNLKHPYLGLALAEFDDFHGLDNLIERIEYGNLTPEVLFDNMKVLKGGVSMLRGTRMLGRYKSFTGEHIKAILSMLKESFDYIVVSVASEADNAGTVYSLLEANEILLVFRNNIANEHRYGMTVDMAFNYKSGAGVVKVFYNQLSDISAVDIGRQVQSSGIEVAGVCDYEPEAIDNVNLLHVHKGLFKQKNKNQEAFSKYAKSIKE